ncbi:hypothetical protein CDCA_CDCA10G3010 [Cyanidium caldarium]|uniref:UBA domain-containing protein n=1 Tax=Cyanidium caldarium TaxID=2771 RepID=A0AAV9IY18_CYACA|nr:hypothetical protein CDCA_CDCA10G3010 [Cyanidium caldarium]
MHVSVVCLDRETTANLKVEADTPLRSVMEMAVRALGLDTAASTGWSLWKDGRRLDGHQTVEEVGMGAYDVLVLQPVADARRSETSASTATDAVAARLAEALLAHGRSRDEIPPQPRDGAAALPISGVRGECRPADTDHRATATTEPSSSGAPSDTDTRRLLQQASGDPFHPDVQRFIERQIQQANIQSNLEAALEYNAESFAQVPMLFVQCRVAAGSARQAQSLIAFVDCGAQATILSLACAERSGLSRLMDRRFTGTARGVGQARVLGRVHLALLELGGEWMECSFQVVEGLELDMLLGLDMMRKHSMCIDLGRNGLRVRDRHIPFLAEHQLPPALRAPLAGPATGVDTGSAVESGEQGQRRQPEEEAKVERLMQLGFDGGTVRRVLAAAGGNEELAASILFGQ